MWSMKKPEVISPAILVITACLAVGACSSHGDSKATPSGSDPIETLLSKRASVLFVGSHPDDETLTGPLLAKACIKMGCRCGLAYFTAGDGGKCDLPQGCHPSLGDVRREELKTVAKRYNAESWIGGFTNYPYYVTGGVEWRNEVRRLWEGQGDPGGWITGILGEFKPEVVITFDPTHGFTNHHEHQVAAGFIEEAIGVSWSGGRAARTRDTGLSPVVLFELLNLYEITAPLMEGTDPGPADDEFDPDQSCGDKSCIEVASEIARLHASQKSSGMSAFITFQDVFTAFYYRRVRLD
jgi:LmbE family N-acetylglucosaminyl deacetylase